MYGAAVNAVGGHHSQARRRVLRPGARVRSRRAMTRAAPGTGAFRQDLSLSRANPQWPMPGRVTTFYTRVLMGRRVCEAAAYERKL